MILVVRESYYSKKCTFILLILIYFYILSISLHLFLLLRAHKYIYQGIAAYLCIELFFLWLVYTLTYDFFFLCSLYNKECNLIIRVIKQTTHAQVAAAQAYNAINVYVRTLERGNKQSKTSRNLAPYNSRVCV
jgi:hypothetical protein